MRVPVSGGNEGQYRAGIGAVSSCLLVTVVAGNGCGGSLFRAETRAGEGARVHGDEDGDEDEDECGYRVGT